MLAGPLAFTNPLQAISSSKSHHLETIFTTETVTYAAPSRLPLVSFPLQPSSSKDPQHAYNSDSSQGNDYNEDDSHSSSLSSRQPSTTTSDESCSSSVDNNPCEVGQDTNIRGFNEKSSAPLPTALTSNMEGDSVMITACSVSASVSSASLRTGLQSHVFASKISTTNYVVQPQPKPRLSVGVMGDIKKPRSSATSTNVAKVDEPINKSGGNRNQSANLKLTQDLGAFLELNEGPNENKQKNLGIVFVFTHV